ncbi:F-box protein At5g62510-like [Cornus florida]|uniref:F-box protein At5g62510-like n=1 Tax=Cornus florida TaxID=4283 RepID=UPI002897E322|nr:F-box protein At5g62510-like [Cornus florida]
MKNTANNRISKVGFAWKVRKLLSLLRNLTIGEGKKQKQPPPLPILPNDIIYEILLLLPNKSLARFRCVCREWNNLLTSSNFLYKCLHYCPCRRTRHICREWKNLLTSSNSSMCCRYCRLPMRCYCRNCRVPMQRPCLYYGECPSYPIRELRERKRFFPSGRAARDYAFGYFQDEEADSE